MQIFKYALSLVLTILVWYIALPVVRYDFYGIYAIIIFFGAILAAVELIHDRKLNKIALALVIAGIFMLTVPPWFTTAPIFRAASYRALLGDVKESSFADDISPVDLGHIRVVDHSIAAKLGDKRIGEDPALGSQAEVGRFSIQKVQDQLYWVAPLLHRSFWKWLDQRDGSPGYVMVSATDPQDVKLVQTLNGKELRIKYQPNAYFGDHIERHVYLNGYFAIGTTDYTFEVDDAGKPFWVITLFHKKIGFSGADAAAVLVVDAEDGSMKEYDIANAPGWIDRIQPEDMIQNQVSDWGKYIKGWLNTITSESEVLKMTPGMSLVYGDDGNVYWYTGMTSSGGDESTVGFLLINTRNKQVNWYKQAGATEIAAMRSAEGKVQEKRYRASFPIMYNILGVPTYFLSLKDKANLPKMFAFVSVEDFGIIGIGEEKTSAFRSFRRALKSKGNKLIPSAEANMKSLTGKVLRIQQDIRDGNSFYYLIVEGQKHLIFVGSSSISVELPLTHAGDEVLLQYDASKDSVIDISGFENLSMGK